MRVRAIIADLAMRRLGRCALACDMLLQPRWLCAAAHFFAKDRSIALKSPGAWRRAAPLADRSSGVRSSRAQCANGPKKRARTRSCARMRAAARMRTCTHHICACARMHTPTCLARSHPAPKVGPHTSSAPQTVPPMRPNHGMCKPLRPADQAPSQQGLASLRRQALQRWHSRKGMHPKRSDFA